MALRQVVLDTETTGLSPEKGHRIIEIGCIELVNRKLTGEKFHVYVNPERQVDPGAYQVHGLSDAFLAEKPTFACIVDAFIEFIDIPDTELIIHNAPFDVGFLNHEFSRAPCKLKTLDDQFEIIDTLAMARHLHPGQRNSLDALCKRYHVDNETRAEAHGALIDADILARVYLAMTAGQTSFNLAANVNSNQSANKTKIPKLKRNNQTLKVIFASEEETALHREWFT